MLPPTWYPGSKDRLPFDLVLVVNKLDSLPKSVSHGYLESWVRSCMFHLRAGRALRVFLCVVYVASVVTLKVKRE